MRFKENPVSKSVSSFIFYKNKILLLLRDKNDETAHPGTWGIIGGGIAEEETALEAMMRESFEEIGIIPKEIRYIGHNKRGYHRFVSKITDCELKKLRKGEEGEKLELISIYKLKKLSLTPTMKDWISNHFSLFEYMSKEDIKDLDMEKLSPFLSI